MVLASTFRSPTRAQGMAVVGCTMLSQGIAGVGCATPLLCVQVANLQSVLTQASFLFVVPTLVGMCALKIRSKAPESTCCTTKWWTQMSLFPHSFVMSSLFVTRQAVLSINATYGGITSKWTRVRSNCASMVVKSSLNISLALDSFWNI